MKDERPYQQGDVLVNPISELPEGLKSVSAVNGNLILAEGEVTGHFHGIKDDGNVALMEDDQGTLFMKVDEPSILTHQEHNAFTIEPGIFKIGIVQEYDHFAEHAANVAD